MTQRSGRFWRQAQPAENATYTDDQRQGWSYDAAGNLLVNDSHTNTFDAAGQQPTSLGAANACGYGYEITQTYDGDQRPARRVQVVRDENYIGDPPVLNCTTETTTTYFIYSAALGGAKLMEVNHAGSKVKGYIYANGQRVAKQEVSAGGASISYHHANPGTNSWVESDSQRYAARQEMGPLGEEVGIFDPYSLPQLPSYIDLHGTQPLFIEGGDPFDLSGGCTLDGLAVSCSFAMRSLQNGSAARAPEQTTQWNPRLNDGQGGFEFFQAFADGYSGWIPQYGRYLGGGFVDTGLDEGTARLNRTPDVWFLNAGGPPQTAPRNPSDVKRDFYKQYGQKLNDCIKKVFGKDAKKVGRQTLRNAPVLDARLNAAQVGAVSGVASAIGSSRPFQGRNGTVLIASGVFNGNTPNTLKAIYGTFVHELGNIRDIRLNPSVPQAQYGRTYGNPSDPVDTDTGAALENCVFGSLQYP